MPGDTYFLPWMEIDPMDTTTVNMTTKLWRGIQRTEIRRRRIFWSWVHVKAWRGVGGSGFIIWRQISIPATPLLCYKCHKLHRRGSYQILSLKICRRPSLTYGLGSGGGGGKSLCGFQQSRCGYRHRWCYKVI